MKYFLLILFVCSVHFINAQVLNIEISEIKSDKGLILLSLYNSEKGFPYAGTSSSKYFNIQPNRGKATLSINDLPTGSYAIALFQDVDGNKKLTTNLFGIPKEGYAFSNNASNMFGVPSFKSASFRLYNDTTIQIRLKYF